MKKSHAKTREKKKGKKRKEKERKHFHGSILPVAKFIALES